jgi:uncharacterized phiE125 gp8 family phage protein
VTYTQSWPSWSADAPHIRLVLVDGPAVEPLTADEARARLNIGSDVSDEVLNAYLMAARQAIDGADGWLGRALITQTWRGTLDYFPACDGGRIFIPLPPLQEITSLSYLDAGGASVVVDPATYQVVQGPRPYILPVYNSNWPMVTTRADAVTIEFTAGYGDDGVDVPEPIRTAIALGAGHIHHIASRNPAVTMEAEEGIGQTRYGVTAEVFKVIDDTVQSLLSIYRVIKI